MFLINEDDIYDARMEGNTLVLEEIYSIAVNEIKNGGKVRVVRKYENADEEIVFETGSVKIFDDWWEINHPRNP